MKTRLPLLVAQKTVQAIANALAPGVERIEVCGSVRRKKPEVGDLELIAIPIFQGDLFGGNMASVLDPILEDLCQAGRLERVKGQDKYKQYLVTKAGCHLDLFLVNAQSWGMQMVIRTGPHAFSQRVVTQRSKGGLLPDDLKVKDGLVWRENEIVPTPEERDVFSVLGMEFVDPEARV